MAKHKATAAPRSDLAPFETWKDVLAYARTGGPLFYQAPLDYRPTELRPGKNQTFSYDVRARTIRIWPPGSVGRGRDRTADPFNADSGHLNRFSRPIGASVRETGVAAHRDPVVRAERKYSMTYGKLPPFEQFAHDVHTRADPDKSNGAPYWPPGTLYPMELVGSNEIALAQDFGGLDEFRTERHRTGRNTRAVGFRGDERQIYDFLEFLVGEWNEGNEEAGDLASSIMTTLGYEWI